MSSKNWYAQLCICPQFYTTRAPPRTPSGVLLGDTGDADGSEGSGKGVNTLSPLPGVDNDSEALALTRADGGSGGGEAKCAELRAGGCGIAVGDFGAGTGRIEKLKFGPAKEAFASAACGAGTAVGTPLAL